MLAAAVVWLVFGAQARDVASLGATYPAADTGLWQALAMETVITFILAFVVVSVATDERVPAAAAGPAVGFALAVGVLVGGPVTGGAVNPARALGPMILAGKFTGAWLYCVGPIAGAVLATLLYDRFVSRAETPGPGKDK
jgi:glycerol uptake facilitator-like aquaporin